MLVCLSMYAPDLKIYRSFPLPRLTLKSLRREGPGSTLGERMCTTFGMYFEEVASADHIFGPVRVSIQVQSVHIGMHCVERV